jgi:hypothetical protein
MPKPSTVSKGNNNATTMLSKEEQYQNGSQQEAGATEELEYNPRQSGKLGPIKKDLSLGARLRRWGRIIIVAVIIFISLFVAFAVVQTGFYLRGVGQDTYNTYHYGPTRTNHITAALGINGDSSDNPSDIEISNQRGSITVQVLPGGDVKKAQIYGLPYQLKGDDVSKTPVWVTIAKENNKTVIVAHIDGQNTTSVLAPDGHGDFVWNSHQ